MNLYKVHILTALTLVISLSFYFFILKIFLIRNIVLIIDNKIKRRMRVPTDRKPLSMASYLVFFVIILIRDFLLS